MPNFEKNIKALLKLLAEDRRVILAIYYDNIIAADKIEKIINDSFPQVKKTRIKLSQHAQQEIIPLLNQAIKKAGKGLLYIYGLEHAGFVYSPESQTYLPTEFLSLINLKRESFFAQAQGKIIFFVNKAFVQQVRQAMADFWDWIFYHFEFSVKDFQNTDINIPVSKHTQQQTQTDLDQLEKQIKQLIKDSDADKKQILDKLVELINSYISQGMATYATSWINKATKYAKEINDYETLTLLYERLADYYIKEGHWKKAEKFLMQAKNIRMRHLSARHKDIGELFNKLGFISKKLGNLDKALQFYTKVAKPHQNKEKILELADSYSNMAKAFVKTKDYHKALEYLKKSLDLRKKVVDKDSEILAENYYRIAQIYFLLKKNDQAKTFLNKARRITNKNTETEKSKLAQDIKALYKEITK